MMTIGPIFEALADETRRTIFEMITPSERSVGEIASKLPVSRPAVSQHLKVLTDAGLAVSRVAGRVHWYRARPEGVAELRSYVDRFWDAPLEAFARAAEREVSNGPEESQEGMT